MTQSNPNRRIDQWLFYSRLIKSRSLASRMVEAGKIRINKEKINKASQAVQVGDVITAMIHQRLRVIRIEALGSRRGPAEEAQGLYTDLTPKEVSPLKNKRFDGVSPSRPKGMGRPTKKDRRKLDSLKHHTE